MPAAVSGNNWEKIRQGLKEAQLLNSQRKYNLAMVKCRQTLEFMVQDLCDKALISRQNANQDLASLIDELYGSRQISKTTREHYHKIRMLGNKAVHDGNDNAYDANQACQLLSHEIVTFSKDYMNDARHNPQQKSGQQRAVPQREGQQRNPAQREPQQRAPQSSRPRNASAQGGSDSGSRSRRRSNQNGFSFTGTDLMRILIIVVAIIVVIALVRLLHSDDSSKEETTAVPSSSVEETTATAEETTPFETETMPETTPAPVYKTTTNLNVRSEPTTNGSKLGLLEAGTVVDFIGDYDEEWAIIDYNGTQAYVSKQYLEHD